MSNPHLTNLTVEETKEKMDQEEIKLEPSNQPSNR
jgi:hypothetical protein